MEDDRVGLAHHMKTFVGLTCRKATTGLAQTLGLWFDTPTGWQDHDWSPVIKTYSGAWRIVKAGAVLAGQYDDEDYGRTMDAALGEMKAVVLIDVDLHSDLPDARLTFSNDLVVEFFTIGRHDKAWEALLPTAKWIEVGPDAAWREVASDDPGGEFTAEERRLSVHAHAFSQRWKGRMPPPSPPGRRCAECAYWRQMQGGYSWWDFGVCSNPRSAFAGTLVSSVTGCRRFSPELEASASASE